MMCLPVRRLYWISRLPTAADWLPSPRLFQRYLISGPFREAIYLKCCFCCFFFSSRRRHTRSDRDWSSDVCSSDLRYLVGLGGRIDGIGSNTLTVEGGAPLRPAPFTIGPDHIEIGSFLGLAAVTNGAVTIDGVRPDDLRATLMAFERLGVRPRLDRARLIVDADQERRIRPDLGGHVPKLEDGPWPAFPADLMSIAIVVASQCEGLLLVFEKLFESRLFFVDKLIGMGARIVLCDPHRAVIAGPSPLRGGVVDSPDIRAGMAMLLAAPSAPGGSVLHNIGRVDRGYERIDERLRALGAQIERLEGQPDRRTGGP